MIIDRISPYVRCSESLRELHQRTYGHTNDKNHKNQETQL